MGSKASSSMVALIDRTAEVAALRALTKRRKPALALLYGRRRVGKTFLLDHVWPKSQRVFYFLAADTTADQNRVELLQELARWAARPLDPNDYRSWHNVFRLFVDLAEHESLVVILDEFPYLMGTGDDVVSHLVAVWDRELKNKPLTLVLTTPCAFGIASSYPTAVAWSVVRRTPYGKAQSHPTLTSTWAMSLKVWLLRHTPAITKNGNSRQIAPGLDGKGRIGIAEASNWILWLHWKMVGRSWAKSSGLPVLLDQRSTPNYCATSKTWRIAGKNGRMKPRGLTAYTSSIIPLPGSPPHSRLSPARTPGFASSP